MSPFITTVSINNQIAKKLLEAGEQKLTEMAVPSNIAIVDAQGFLLAFSRMDEAPLPSIEHAINKGFTSALFKTATHTLAQDAEPGGSLYGLNITLNQRVIVFAGGQPLFHHQQLVGAVGVSGGTAEQDLQAAKFIAETFDAIVEQLAT